MRLGDLEPVLYVYVDLGFVERLFDEVHTRVYPDLKRSLHLPYLWTDPDDPDRPVKVFVYDCEPNPRDVRRNEPAEAYEARVEAHDRRLREIELLDDVFLRCGRLTERRRKRGREQKRVDVNIAVDMLTHASRGLMRNVLFFANDDDFTPLLRAMMDTPCSVALACDPRSVHHDLMASAARVRELGPREVAMWAWEPTGMMPMNAPDGLHSIREPFSPPQGSEIREIDGMTVIVSRATGPRSPHAWIAGTGTAYAAGMPDTALRAVCFAHGLRYEDVLAVQASYRA
jgi:uncharacterized LabA/DUF88 family protein